jgi:hypothetical protein
MQRTYNADEERSLIVIKFGSMNHLAQSGQSSRLIHRDAFLKPGPNDFPLALLEKRRQEEIEQSKKNRRAYGEGARKPKTQPKRKALPNALNSA